MEKEFGLFMNVKQCLKISISNNLSAVTIEEPIKLLTYFKFSLNVKELSNLPR